MATEADHHEDNRSDSNEQVDPAIVKLLAHRYGDGLVYLRGREERQLYARAVGLGLINRDGYVTPQGRALIASHGGD